MIYPCLDPGIWPGTGTIYDPGDVGCWPVPRTIPRRTRTGWPLPGTPWEPGWSPWGLPSDAFFPRELYFCTD